MVFQIQHFEVAELIFISNQNSTILPSERKEIQSRFQSIIDLFLSHDKDYNAGFIKNGKDSLPYNSSTYFSNKNDELILHFSFSFKNPTMMIIDSKKNTVRNFVDMEQIKIILNDMVYDNVKDNLLSSRYLNNRFKGIPDINRFVEMYQVKLEEYSNPNTITGRDCFEIDLSDF